MKNQETIPTKIVEIIAIFTRNNWNESQITRKLESYSLSGYTVHQAWLVCRMQCCESMATSERAELREFLSKRPKFSQGFSL